ncbi:unnamed protein product [Adineta steineri]|uniref:Uncharacterized protein n=1 Tax=Adineta steineri TaxID=433720 RepID=A0A815LE25_9BILA|nr:unnamed protein product [Adineta steineri]
MTFPLPANSLSLFGDSFYNVVKQFCGVEAVKLLKFQLIDTSMDLLEVDDVFSILQFESDQTATLKQILGVPCKDEVGNYSFFIMPGLRLKLNKFIHTLRSLLPSTDSSSTTKRFALPLTDGFPSTQYFSTNLLADLEMWYDQVDKASLRNLHVVQPVCPPGQTSPPSFILSCYGTSGKNIRVLGFSTDCEPRSLNAMRNAMGFFSKSEVQFEEYPHHFKISFLKVGKLRVEKLAALQAIKSSSESNNNNLIFPKHHKQSQQKHQVAAMHTTTILTEKLIQDTVFSAYLQACQILSDCNLSILDPNGITISSDEVNRLAFQKLTTPQCKIFSQKDHQSNNSKQDEDDDYEEYLSQKQYNANNNIDDYDQSISSDESDTDVLPNVSNSTFRGMRIFDSINSNQSASFFSVEVNGQKKFMHKQAANWYFYKTKPILSSDRSIRVQNK